MLGHFIKHKPLIFGITAVAYKYKLSILDLPIHTVLVKYLGVMCDSIYKEQMEEEEEEVASPPQRRAERVSKSMSWPLEFMSTPQSANLNL